MRKRPPRIESTHLIKLTDKVANTVGELIPKGQDGFKNIYDWADAGCAAPVYWMVPPGGIRFEILSWDAEAQLGYSPRYLRKLLRTLKHWGFIAIEREGDSARLLH
jgi:hypothetical protein